MSILFKSTTIGTLELRNRFVRSATYDAATRTPGHISDKQLAIYSDLAKGGVGLIISGIMFVHPTGKFGPFMNSIASDDAIPALKKLTDQVHQMGAKIAVQLFHAGREAFAYMGSKNKKAFAPSYLTDDPYFSEDHKAMSEAEINEIICAYGDAALRAKEAGFDAVQFHGAHAYLPAQFLSPHTNRRNDQWGGSLENRLRFHLEALRDMKAKTDNDFPIFIKIGVADGIPEGLEFEEGQRAAVLLAEAGYDCLEISSGLRGKTYQEAEFKTKLKRVENQAYFRNFCRSISRQVSVPTMMVGGIRHLDMMEEIINNNEADFIALCRPLIREPFLIGAWQQDREKTAACISCNQCYESIRKGIPLHCPVDKKLTEGTE